MPDLAGEPKKSNSYEELGLPKPMGGEFKSGEHILTTKPENEQKTKPEIEKQEITETTPDQQIAQVIEKTAPQVAPQVVATPKDELTEKIESIMTEDLEDVFKKMSPAQQNAFKVKGEETANKIQKILNSTKVKFKKIIKLLAGWLKMIPGVNKFYLEQEAKIKADKLIHLKEGSVYDNYNEKI